MSTYTDDEIYDMYANQADPAALDAATAYDIARDIQSIHDGEKLPWDTALAYARAIKRVIYTPA